MTRVLKLIYEADAERLLANAGIERPKPSTNWKSSYYQSVAEFAAREAVYARLVKLVAEGIAAENDHAGN